MQEMPRTGYCMFLSQQWISGCDRVQEMPRQATVGFGLQQGILGCDRVLVFFFVSRHDSQILSHRNCCNMAFLVAIGVQILYRDDVAIEVFLSRPRRPRQEVRYRDRVLLWVRNFMSGQSILGRDRVWSRLRVVLVMIGYFYVAM